MIPEFHQTYEAETFAATGLEQLLRLALQLQRPEALANSREIHSWMTWKKTAPFLAMGN